MDAAFVIVVRKPAPRAEPRPPRPFVDARAVDLGFEPAAHVSWHDHDDGIAVDAWQSSAARPSQTRWLGDDRRLVMSVGHLSWRNRPAAAEGEWAALLADATARGSLVEVADELRGMFALAALDADGHGMVVADPLGLRCVYHGEDDDRVVVSSRAHLVAAVLASPGRPAARDPVGTCWLGFSSYRIGVTTGFAGVHVLPPGAAIRLDARTGASISRGAPWLPDERLRAMGRDELTELVRDDIADALQSALTAPADRHVIGLTGGKDSRLLLAVALWKGLAHDFEYDTVGPPGLADVEVASALAERFGLRHEVRFFGLRPKEPYAERVRTFASATGGMLNLWDLTQPSSTPRELRVVGLCGELLRTFRPLRREIPTADQLLSLFRMSDLSRLPLLQPDVARQFHEAAIDSLLDDPTGECAPFDLFDAFYFRNRLRFTRTGPQEELLGGARVSPLYSIAAIRAAFSLGGPARQQEVLHHDVIRRCSDALASLPFAGPGWDPALLATTTKSRTQTAAGSTVAPATPPPKAESVMAAVQRESFDEREAFLREVSADRANPAWSILDRAEVVSALERFGSLTLSERRQLYGALTAVLWLADAE